MTRTRRSAVGLFAHRKRRAEFRGGGGADGVSCALASDSTAGGGLGGAAGWGEGGDWGEAGLLRAGFVMLWMSGGRKTTSRTDCWAARGQDFHVFVN